MPPLLLDWGCGYYGCCPGGLGGCGPGSARGRRACARCCTHACKGPNTEPGDGSGFLALWVQPTLPVQRTAAAAAASGSISGNRAAPGRKRGEACDVRGKGRDGPQQQQQRRLSSWGPTAGPWAVCCRCGCCGRTACPVWVGPARGRQLALAIITCTFMEWYICNLQQTTCNAARTGGCPLGPTGSSAEGGMGARRWGAPAGDVHPRDAVAVGVLQLLGFGGEGGGRGDVGRGTRMNNGAVLRARFGHPSAEGWREARGQGWGVGLG